MRSPSPTVQRDELMWTPLTVIRKMRSTCTCSADLYQLSYSSRLNTLAHADVDQSSSIEFGDMHRGDALGEASPQMNQGYTGLISIRFED